MTSQPNRVDKTIRTFLLLVVSWNLIGIEDVTWCAHIIACDYIHSIASSQNLLVTIRSKEVRVCPIYGCQTKTAWIATSSNHCLAICCLWIRLLTICTWCDWIRRHLRFDIRARNYINMIRAQNVEGRIFFRIELDVSWASSLDSLTWTRTNSCTCAGSCSRSWGHPCICSCSWTRAIPLIRLRAWPWAVLVNHIFTGRCSKINLIPCV